MEGVQRNQITKELVCCDWEFDFYSNCNGKPLEYFEWLNGISVFYLRRTSLTVPHRLRSSSREVDEMVRDNNGLLSRFSSQKFVDK